MKLSCSCTYSTELQAFANDPGLRSHRFGVNKDCRGHLHRVIDRDGPDKTHIIYRMGSPQTLVCTKDRRGFNQHMKQYRNEIGAMSTLLNFAPNSGGSSGLSARMKLAVQRADAGTD